MQADDLEECWTHFKRIIKTSAETVCGRMRVGSLQRKPSWWTNEVKIEVQKKKKLWRKYLQSKRQEDYNSYKEQRAIAKNAVKRAKEMSWMEFGRKMESDFGGNQKLFSKTLKSMRTEKPCLLKCIKSEEGTLLTKDEEIMSRWREYFCELLEGEGRGTPDHSQKEEYPGVMLVEEDIRQEEMRAAINKMEVGKAAGHDEITPEMIKYIGVYEEKLLLKVLRLAWKYKKIPKDWELGIIIPIFENGDDRECKNHRGITLLSVPGKIYSCILQNQLQEQVEHQLDEA
ncbi:uncharacterized protein LOC120352044 [Nilaparvata lugens]|uniref:uncharacterized protein LOC120352044 n=1 Tax=Nilaparvata lugens TaxID=108931 RepID=UPI00193DC2F9|nr:uncharacterized protein LOC120352044 [Nilaparvata lugens]